MKSFHSVLALVLCLAMAGNAHSGTSSSYKSGFSSQKNNAARSHGSPAQPRRNTSAMSRDVDQGAARANALKTLEARRAAANMPPPAQPLPPLNDTLRRPPQQQPVYQTPPVYQPPMQQPSGNGLMHGLMGFMLGRAMSQSNQPVSYPTVSNGQPQPAAQPDTAGMVGGMPGLGEPATAPAPSFGASVLRWFIWLALLSVIVWAVVYSVRKLRRMRAANTPNYSFERN
jgi:hypothetical protein